MNKVFPTIKNLWKSVLIPACSEGLRTPSEQAGVYSVLIPDGRQICGFIRAIRVIRGKT